MRRRRTDVVSERLDAMPRWGAFPLRFILALSSIFRYLAVLFALGGAISILVGVVTLNAERVAAGFGQALVSCMTLAISSLSSENVIGTRSPLGLLVVAPVVGGCGVMNAGSAVFVRW